MTRQFFITSAQSIHTITAAIFLLSLGLLFTLSASALEPGSETTKRPNVILIMTDDQGYGDLACHGNPVIKTPHLDRLHADSVRLTNFHVDPVCAPTRAALMTGRYSHRAGVWSVVLNTTLLPSSETTMGDLFSKGGYRTACFGKWHLGDNYPYRPEDRGFQEVVMHGGGVIGHTPDYWLNDYFDDHYLHNGRWEKFAGYCTDVWFDNAVEFARKSDDRPFFIYLPLNAPHQPRLVPESYLKPYADLPDRLQRFYGMISCIDDNVGELREDLEKSGLERDTILIFMTDNGSVAGPGGYSAGMRGAKGSQYEGGHRVPCFIYWPSGKITGGRDVDRLTAHIDLLPTLANLCNLPVPEDLQLDGRDLTPLLKDSAVQWEDRTLFVEWQQNSFTRKWHRCSVMTEQWRLIDGEQLYDIRTDPGQKKDIASEHAELVAQLRRAYELWWSEVSTRDDLIREIPVGAVATPSVTLTTYSWITEKGNHNSLPWCQDLIIAGQLQNGYWPLHVERDGAYRIRLRRWPVESGLAINDTTDAEPPEKSNVKPTVIRTTQARMTIQDVDETRPVGACDREIVFDVQLKAGSARLQTWFADDEGRTRGAYYTQVEYLGSGGKQRH